MKKLKKKMQVVREEKGFSKRGLALESSVDSSFILWIEQRGFIPYDPQLYRIAKALAYEGDPQDLLEEVED